MRRSTEVSSDVNVLFAGAKFRPSLLILAGAPEALQCEVASTAQELAAALLVFESLLVLDVFSAASGRMGFLDNSLASATKFRAIKKEEGAGLVKSVGDLIAWYWGSAGHADAAAEVS